MDYTTQLTERFKDLEINLRVHDISSTGMPCYIEVKLPKPPAAKDRGSLVLDLGNYISRVLGLRYQMCPEFRGKGKNTTLRWFMSWDNIQPIRANILKAFNKSEKLLRHREYLPFEFSCLIIQNSKRGVYEA